MVFPIFFIISNQMHQILFFARNNYKSQWKENEFQMERGSAPGVRMD